MVVIDLQVNKNMLDIKFEGYKLSLNPIPILKQPLIDGVRCVELSNDDYSYIQTRMNLLLNHLFQDPWNQNSIFYVNKKNNVIWTSLGQDGRLHIPRCVWEVPDTDFGNITVSFPSADWAVLCNGKGYLFILYTPSRAAGEPWMCYLKYDLLIKSPCYLLHAVHRNTPGGQQLDCVVAAVEHKSKLPEDCLISDCNTFVSLLDWISFSCGQNNQVWTVKRTRKLAGPSFPDYVAIDNTEDAINVVSQDDFQFYFDSDGSSYPIEVAKKKVPETYKYTFIQTLEDITVYFRLPQDTSKSDVQVNFEPFKLEVLIRGTCVLTGQFPYSIDCSASNWILDGEKLEVTLYKAEIGLMWSELIKDNKEGYELTDKALAGEIHHQLAHLTAENEVTPSNKVPFNLEQLEECDSSTEQLTFQRIDGNKHDETHKINLGGHQWLFSEQINPENLPAICLRYDVDGILWQPKNISSEGELENFKMEHSATFSALGYVAASKQDKKFTACSPDFQYAVISDCARHLYVYCQPESLHSALELRNRRTGESIAHIAKQYVISLEECDRMLGLRASSQCIFVLSKDMLYAAKVASEYIYIYI